VPIHPTLRVELQYACRLRNQWGENCFALADAEMETHLDGRIISGTSSPLNTMSFICRIRPYQRIKCSQALCAPWICTRARRPRIGLYLAQGMRNGTSCAAHAKLRHTQSLVRRLPRNLGSILKKKREVCSLLRGEVAAIFASRAGQTMVYRRSRRNELHKAHRDSSR
jgi:hypothetical protein